MMYLRTAVLLLAILAFEPRDSRLQELPLLDAETVHIIKQEISGDAAYEHIRHNTQFHRPRGGADGLWQVAEYYERKARKYGLEDVQLIRQDYFIVPWNATSAEIWIEGPRPRRIASYLQTPLHLADYSAPADVRGDLVDVGEGVADEDYAGKAIAGNVVFAHGPLAAVHQEAVVNRNAAGIVWHPNPLSARDGRHGLNLSYPDQVRWSRLPIGEERRGFAFILSLRQGAELLNQLTEAGGSLPVRARVDASFDSRQGDEPWQVMVEAYIRGTEPELHQDIVLTAHMQEEKFSANDDASGCASILEIGRALSKLIGEGILPRPRRNLRFWWVTEFSSQRQYFADHPRAHREMWVNINQDMVGADQSQDVLRVQNVTRLPATRFHFFNDVAEAVIDYMVATNNAELAQTQAGTGPLYPDPHTAHLGSMHRYNAKMIFFHGNTDHVPFNEAPIGVPGITFTNWPDNYIHTSDDDLWNIDRTQLGRNAAAGALIAWIMAAAGDGAAPLLAAETLARGGTRLNENLGLGLRWISAEPEDPAGAYRRAVFQLEYAADRERRAVRSLSEVGPRGIELADRLSNVVEERFRAVRNELDAHFETIAGEPPPEISLTDEEQQLAEILPRLVAGPDVFLNRRGQIGGVPGLHGLMAFEVLNAVNGERTALEIYRLVSAQAREAGAHYYGAVQAGAVGQYLRNAAALDLVEW